MYKYKRRFVPVFRDFPQGCGHNHNTDESLSQSKSKNGIFQAHRTFPDFSRTQEASSSSSNHQDLDNSRDVAKDEPVLESIGSVKDHQKKKVIGEIKNKQNQSLKCSVKKRRLSLHNSTMEVKRVIVCGLAAYSKCPWSQPRKKRGSRQVNHLR